MALPSFDHIVIVLEENHGYTDIIGNTTDAPYINSLVQQAALFTDSHGGPDVAHPSFPNYMQFFSGATQGVVNDNCPPAGQPYSAANMASAVIAAGGTFGGYAEDAPTSRTACSNSTGGTYAGRHVPYAWFSNVPANSIHDFATSFPTTATGYAALPTVSFVVPGLDHDMHSFGTETLAQRIQFGDAWLKTHIDGYLQWAKTHNSLLILQWDEDAGTTGDHIPTLFCGANIHAGSYSEHITHYNVLRTICDLTGAAPMAGASLATTISDCWTTTPGPAPVPAFDHILIVVMENHGVNQIIGQTSVAPYINGLLGKAAYFSQSYAIRHPSSPSYLALFSGSTQGITPSTSNPSVCPPPGAPYNAANLASNLIAAGKTFGGYAMSIPANPLDCTSAIYDPNHVPWLRFSNIPTTGPTSIAHNFTSFPATPTGFAALPTVSWVVPDGNNSMESSSTLPAAITQGDNFLKNNIDAYITWAQTHNSLLILTWDEDQGFLNGNGGSSTGGGHVVTMFLGAGVVPGTYPEASISASVGVAGIDSYNILRTVEDSLSLAHAGNAATALPVIDCWTKSGGQPGVPTGLAVTGTTATSVSLSWAAPSTGAAGYDVFVGGTKQLTQTGTTATVTGLTSGTTYSFTVDAFNGNGAGAQTAAVTATPGGQAQSGWGGISFTHPTGFTAITATFTVPALTGDTGALCSIWVGLGNVQQTGIFCAYNTGKPGSNAARAWSWYLPAGEQWDETHYPVNAGDSITFTLSFDTTYFYTTQTNHTQGWAYTEQKSIQAASQGGSTGGGGFLFPYTTAEVIIEKEGSNDLPDYGTLTFTNVSTTPAFTGTVPISTVNTAVDQSPGAFSGGSFTMTWQAFR